MASHVLYVGKPGPYLIGDDRAADPLMVRIFRPTADGKGNLSDELHVASVLAHMPYTSFEEYDGPAEEEAAILDAVEKALARQQAPPETPA